MRPAGLIESRFAAYQRCYKEFSTLKEFDWDVEYERRREELSRIPAESRAQALLDTLRQADLLKGHDLGETEEIYKYTVSEMKKNGAIEPFHILAHFDAVVVFEVEGDFYEEGSYTREMKRLFEMTSGEIAASNVRDQIDNETATVTVYFDWDAEPYRLESKSRDGVMDYFDTQIIHQLNKILDQKGIPRRFISFADVEYQSMCFIYLDPEKRTELEKKNLLIFSKDVAYSERALSFLW